MMKRPHWYGYLIGVKADRVESLIGEVNKGFSYEALEKLQNALSLPIKEIAEAAQINPRTLLRRKASGRFQPDESDRLLRLARVTARALELFEGDLAAARRWLNEPQEALNQQTPLSMARTEIGSREVEHLIGRLEHGVFT
jgi:putative toxin-antitoxin system antitoxin component (TIGR02293 family)